MNTTEVNDPEYRIRVTGELNPDVNREQAVAGLAKMFRIDHGKAQQILASPTVIKSGVDQFTAQKFQKALNSIGIQSAIETNGPPAHESAPGAAVNQSAPLANQNTPAENQVKPAVSPPVAAEPSAGINTPATADDLVPVPTEAEQPGFKFKVEGRPDYAFLTVNVPGGQTIRVEASAMATMDTNMVMKTKAKGGLGRFLTSESIFINEFTAENGPSEMGIAPASPGDLAHVFLQGDTIYLQNSAFVASAMDVQVETKWQGLTKGFFSGESLFLIRCSGNGDLWFNTYGGLIMLDVDGDYVVDTGNIVAFTEGLEYKITKVGGYKSLFFSGEGFVCRFSGKGKVWIQTRTVQALTSFVYPFRPVKKK